MEDHKTKEDQTYRRTYTSLFIANTFLEEFGGEKGIEHMKLQKLVYLSYGYWLIKPKSEGERLTWDQPGVWKHGPVFPDLYGALKIFGRKPLTEMQSRSPFTQPEKVDEDDEEVRSMLKWVWNRYGHLSSFVLANMAHKPGSSWHRFAEDKDFKVPSNTILPDEYIIEEFEGLLCKNEKRKEVANPAPEAA